ncbi:MAG: DedA family protein [Candidatus Binatia bacterium]
MEFLTQAIDIFLNVDKHLAELAVAYGVWIYAVLFFVIFCETGLVVTPFLPGDSLLFAAGALCSLADAANGGMSMWVLVPLLVVAAVLGDAANFAIGTAVGPGFLEKKKLRVIKKEHLERTQHFYAKYGGKTIVLARFVPIVRTFAPFVAGIGRMDYSRFVLFNVVGAIAWVVICTVAGYLFGQVPIVQEHFELVILGIILISVLPIVFEVLRSRRGSPAPSA